MAVVDASWPGDQYGATVSDGVPFEIFVYVDGLDGLVERFRDDGGTVLRDADPDGNPVALAQTA